MANHIIKNPAPFTSELRRLEPTDRNHADVFNKVFEVLINNDAFLEKIADEAVRHMKDAASHVPSNKGAAEGSYLKSDGTWAVPPDTDTIYSHPITHPANMITQDVTHRFVTDDEKTGWNGKADGNHSHNYSTLTNRPTGLDSGYVRTGQTDGTSTGVAATAEGYLTIASGNYSHAEGYNVTASDNYSHAEGNYTTASGDSSHAEGYNVTASGDNSHAEGERTKASGINSHTEGSVTKASGISSHAEGNCTEALGNYSHAEGFYCKTETGATQGAHASGDHTIAKAQSQTVIGAYNVVYDTKTDGIFIIGNGTSSARSNALRVTYNGTAYGKAAYQTSGADYAEFFEWVDKNPDKEDRRGYFVTVEGNQIRLATSTDSYILGVVSAKPVVVGNSDPDDWHGRFLTDIFGNFLTELVEEEYPVLEEIKEEEIYTDEEGNEATRQIHKTVERTEKRMVESYILNPEYNPDQPYTPRSERPEWSPVGMLGQLIVRDDGTCQVDGFCTVANGGIATEAKSGYRVIERVTENLVKIIFR